ncbi:hypothetical protein F4553_006459 [Allocatelliglobosispora scoriae]|uniref:Beta-lactamase class A catalytic domain-containing protein n=1 Tax=Allocatelliglobosispora scoriae TaxID=643052 RepID=A0A841BZB2_9ACTN|nr:serine hydrolase [Allocatelliglobosispora scoriae]MBB5873025.1 hypothetical protein [Allocatelliglobosispora scoriae]
MQRRILVGVPSAILAVALAGGVGHALVTRTDETGELSSAPVRERAAAVTQEKAPEAEVPKAPTVAVATKADTWFSWQLIDTATGTSSGSANAADQTNNTESMIKAWIGTDYIAAADAQGRALTAEEKALITKMIRFSDDAAAQTLYLRQGGDEVIERLISEAKLTGTTVTESWWSKTQMTALDATRMMTYILQRAEASAQTAWLVGLMRDVDPSNAFGIPEVLPAAADPAVKNGWTAHESTGLWNVNSLAAWDGKILVVMTHYPVAYGQAYGEQLIRDVASDLLPSL